jgi:copper chaperone CopZ
MMCGNCVETISNALNATSGVSGCEVDLEQKRAVVMCDRALADTALVGAIERSDTLYAARVARF